MLCPQPLSLRFNKRLQLTKKTKKLEHINKQQKESGDFFFINQKSFITLEIN